MKIHFGTLALGLAAGGVAAWYYMTKVQVPNAYAVGQANPTLPYPNLSAAQKAQFSTQPTLPSPPSASTVIGGAISGINGGVGLTNPGATAGQSLNGGTGALLGRGGKVLPIHYNRRRG